FTMTGGSSGRSAAPNRPERVWPGRSRQAEHASSAATCSRRTSIRKIYCRGVPALVRDRSISRTARQLLEQGQRLQRRQRVDVDLREPVDERIGRRDEETQLRRVRRTRRGTRQLLVLEQPQKLACADQDDVRKSGQSSDLDAIRPI